MSGSDPIEYAQGICLKIFQSRRRNSDADVYLKPSRIPADGSPAEISIPAHKTFLRISPYFDTILGDGNSNSNSNCGGIVEIPVETDPETLEAILKYIYTGIIELTSGNISEMIEGAKLFGLPKLLAKCNETQELNLVTGENWDKLLRFFVTNLAELSNLFELVMQFIKGNIKDLIHSDLFRQLSYDEIKLLLDPSQHVFPSRKEFTKGIFNWIGQDSARKLYLDEFLDLEWLKSADDNDCGNSSTFDFGDNSGTNLDNTEIILHTIDDKSEIIGDNSESIVHNSEIIVDNSDNSVTIGDKSGKIGENSEKIVDIETIIDNSGLIGDNFGIIGDISGTIIDKSELIVDNSDNSVTIGDKSGIIGENSEKIVHNSGLIGDNFGLIVDNSGIIGDNSELNADTSDPELIVETHNSEGSGTSNSTSRKRPNDNSSDYYIRNGHNDDEGVSQRKKFLSLSNSNSNSNHTIIQSINQMATGKKIDFKIYFTTKSPDYSIYCLSSERCMSMAKVCGLPGEKKVKGFGLVFGGENKLFMIGGRLNIVSSKDVKSFVVKKRSVGPLCKKSVWQSEENLLHRVRFVAPILVGNSIYLFGGKLDDSKDWASESVMRFDLDGPKGEKWSLGFDMKYSRTFCGVAFHNNIFYMAGGEGKLATASNQSMHTLKSMEMYDLGQGEGRGLKAMKRERIKFQLVYFQNQLWAIGGKIYGKQTKSDRSGYSSMTVQVPTDSVQIYDIEENEWKEGPPMNHPRSEFGAFVANNCIYVIGGNEGSKISMEKYDPIYKSWEIVETPKFPQGASFATCAIQFNSSG